MKIIKYYRRDPTSTYAGAEVSLMVDDDGHYIVQIVCVINDEDVEVMYERAFKSEQYALDVYNYKVAAFTKLFV